MLTIVLLYAAFLGVGWLAGRKNPDRTPADFIVAGRAMPLWLATFTMTATWVDGGYLLGTAEGVYRSSIATGLQGGVCFGLSLILGGVLFAKRMRALGFTTLIDLFEARFGPGWAAVLSLPAMFAEMFWSAELLVALGSTFGVILGLDLVTAIAISAAVVTIYTMSGGMWAVAYTDALQLALVVIGLGIAAPIVLDAVGGLAQAWEIYRTTRPEAAALVPPLTATSGLWTGPAIVSWWDVSVMLVLGGIPWNCYFQRVLSCRTPDAARAHSLIAGALTMTLTIPPLMLGLAASVYPWPAALAQQLSGQPADAVPMLFRYVTPPLVGALGLAAIIGAVTSSFSSSILSASAMFSWNTCLRLLKPTLSFAHLRVIMRVTIAALGLGAAVLALKVQSVQALWFFTSDLVFVLLFPQLFYALFDRRVNIAGSVAAFLVSLVLRLGGGEPLFGLAPLIPYPEIAATILPIDPVQWYDTASGALLFPFKTTAAATGMLLLPLVSRLTASWSPPRTLAPTA